MTDNTTTSLRQGAMLGIVGAAITGIGAAAVQITVQPHTDISDKMFSYPWSPSSLVPISILWGAAHLLVGIGIVTLNRSGVLGSSRAAARGLAAAVAGTALLLVGEVGSIFVRNAKMDDSTAMVVGASFGLGTLLTAVGFVVAGIAAARGSRWGGWRRYAPLAAGIWACALMVLSTTKALPVGVAVYGASLAAVFYGLYTEPTPAARQQVAALQPA